MVRDLLRLLKSTVTMVTAVALSAAILGSAFLMYRVWTDTRSVTQTAFAPFSWAGDMFRIVTGSHQHGPASDDSKLDELTIELAAAAIGKDSEGEDPRFRSEVMILIFDTMLRNRDRKSGGVSIPVNFRKAYTWIPLGWDHNAHVPALTRWTTGWVDRDLEKTRRTVPPDILKTAREIVRSRKAPDPAHCAVVIVRAKDSGASRWSGELEARAWIVDPKNMRPDPVLSTRGFKTQFFCRN